VEVQPLALCAWVDYKKLADCVAARLTDCVEAQRINPS